MRQCERSAKRRVSLSAGCREFCPPTPVEKFSDICAAFRAALVSRLPDLWRVKKLTGRETSRSDKSDSPLVAGPCRLCVGWRSMSAFVALYVCASLVFGAALSAQEPPLSSAELTLPEGVPPFTEGGISTVINTSNINAWRGVVVPELVPSIKSGELRLAAREKLGYFWRIDDPWEGESYRNASANKRALVSGSTALRAELVLNRGYPFGAEAEMLADTDPQLLGARIVWNLQSVWWGQGSIESTFDLTWLKEGRPTRLLRGEFVRAYPALLGAESGAQIFRERLTLTAPEAIGGLAWLSFRFRGGDEDVVWFHSPALRKARQLTGSNRSDPFARGVTTVDDLLVWSGKAELVEATADRSAVGLAPFASADLGQLSPEGEGCFGVNRSEGRDDITDAKFAPSLEDASTPLNGAIFVPRRLWRVELISSDPYSHYGRQLLYVDKASMLPVYKFVYDRSGHLWKTVIGVFGLGASADRKTKRPYLATQFVIDHIRQEANLIDFSRFLLCGTPHEGLGAANFDPRKLWPQPTPAPEKAPTKRR